MTGWAFAALMASLSLNQYEPPTKTMPIPSPIMAPPAPQKLPIPIMSPPSRASRTKVLKLLRITHSLKRVTTTNLGSGYGPGVKGR